MYIYVFYKALVNSDFKSVKIIDGIFVLRKTFRLKPDLAGKMNGPKRKNIVIIGGGAAGMVRDFLHRLHREHKFDSLWS